MQQSKKQILAAAFALVVTAALSSAQEAPGLSTNQVFVRSGQAGGVVTQGAVGLPTTIQYVASEMSFEGKVVKGVPYSAQAVTETNQTLADGNRIHRTVTAGVYRDSEGRTRREQTFAGIGVLAPASDAPQTVFINDPVSGTNYVLETATKVARKMPAPPSGAQLAKLLAEQKASTGTSSASSSTSTSIAREPLQSRVMVAPLAGTASATFGTAGAFAIGGGPSSQMQAHTDSLGKQTIEGVLAEGSRTTMTIAAGAIGNDQPIDVVSERWYSPELQTVVMTKHSDPRMGETVYRLTNINRSEPSSTLFQVPPDYTLEDRPSTFHLQIPKPGETK
jgi:hypothetical protein